MSNFKSLIIMTVSSVIPIGISAQTLLPKPQYVEWRRGVFATDDSRAIKMENAVGPDADNIYIPQWARGGSGGEKVVRMEPLGGAASPEAYRLHVTKDTLLVRADSRDGFLRAWQTIALLTTRKGVSCCDIADTPTYKWRGLMIDVSRHFFPIDFLKRQVDIMARFKLNRLQLHLADAEGWRMEIKRYPRLTGMTAYRPQIGWDDWHDHGSQYCDRDSAGAYGGFYTQDELRELVGYAAQRGVTIVPEIEMPGHSAEVLTAYPELSCTHEPYKQADYCPGNIGTYDFLEHVLEEVMAVFPSPYIHVGGDEARKKSWPSCPLCQKKMREIGTTSVNDLQTYLISRIGHWLNDHGRQLVGWDEIIDGDLAQGTMVTVWRDTQKAHEAISHGYDVVLTPEPYCYLDAYQDEPQSQPVAIGGYTPLRKTYDYVPGGDLPEDERKHVAGLQGNLWTEYIHTPEHVEYMLYPRALAIAETAWSGGEGKDYGDFKRRVEAELRQLRQEGVHPYDITREKGERKASLKPLSHKAVGASVTDNGNPKRNVATLTDGKLAGWTFRDSRWARFSGNDGMDITIDLGKVTSVSEVKADFLKSPNQYILRPSEMTIEASDDGKEFTEIDRQTCSPDDSGQPVMTWYSWKGRCRARYLRIKAKRTENRALLFCDEVVVR